MHEDVDKDGVIDLVHEDTDGVDVKFKWGARHTWCVAHRPTIHDPTNESRSKSRNEMDE